MNQLQPRLRLVISTVLLFGLMALMPGTRAVAQIFELPPQNEPTSERPLAQQRADRSVRLTLLPDYEQGTVEVRGELSSEPSLLAEWGLADSLQIHQIDEQTWHLSGPLPGNHLRVDDDGQYHLTLGPLTLAPGDSLALLIPFVNISWPAIDPPPDNLAQLTGSVKPLLPSLRYEGGQAGRTLQFDLPFKPIRREIDLTLTPLVGERLRGQTDSFRLSGQVIFEGIDDFATFERYCQGAPASPFFRYRVADLLFALDYPPAFHFGFLSPIYQFKPTYTLLRSDLLSCELEAGTGQVQAQFQGRVFDIPQNQSRFPEALSRQDVSEAHRPYAGFGAVAGEYELKLGRIMLAPGDLLRVSLPQTTLHGVDPSPDRYVYDRSGPTQIEYQGPRRLALALRYTPDPELLLRQAPATGRALLAPLETGPGPLFGRGLSPAQRLWSWGLLVVGSVLAVSALRGRGRLQSVGGFVAWLLLSVALLYGLRGIFGWLLLAVGWYFFGHRPDRSRLLAGGSALLLVLVALLADARSETLFTVLSTIELQLTPLTPLILTLLAAALYGLVVWAKDRQLNPLSPANLPALLFFLFSLSIYDVLQKSLPALLLVAGGAALVTYRLSQGAVNTGQSAEPDLSERFRLVRQSWLIPTGVLLFTILAMQHNLQQTAAIFGPALGLWGPVLIPVLLFISVLLALSAIALLFMGLYPLLPFRAGTLKAIGLALFLLAVFVLGVGSDDRLINVLETLLAGRVIYYLSVPLLIGLYFDIDRFRRGENARRESEAEEAESLSFEQAAGLYLKEMRGLAGTVGTVLSLIAPSLYAYFFNQPIVTTYFDLLEQLIRLSVVGF